MVKITQEPSMCNILQILFHLYKLIDKLQNKTVGNHEKENSLPQLQEVVLEDVSTGQVTPALFLTKPQAPLNSSSSELLSSISYQISHLLFLVSDHSGLPSARILSSWLSLNPPLPLVFPLGNSPSADPHLDPSLAVFPLVHAVFRTEPSSPSCNSSCNCS